MNRIRAKIPSENWYRADKNIGRVQEYRVDPETTVCAMQIKQPKGRLICSPKGEIVMIQNTTSESLSADIKVLGKTNRCCIGPNGVIIVAPWSLTEIVFHKPLNLLGVSIPDSFFAKCTQMDFHEYQRQISPRLTESLMEPDCSQAMRTIWGELGHEGAHSRLLIEGTAFVILGSILRRVRRLPEQDAPRLCEDEMLQVADFIETNLDDQTLLGELSGSFDLPLADFQSAFKTAFGMSAKKYIIERRVFRARTLITESKESFAGIAAACGYYDQSHMIHTFKRQLGFTPGKLRKTAALEVVGQIAR